MATAPERKPSEPPPGITTWVARMLKAARVGAPSLRTLLTSDLEMTITCGSTKEFARGATIVSEWLAGRIAMAQHFEAHPPLVRGSRLLAQISVGGDSAAYPAVW